MTDLSIVCVGETLWDQLPAGEVLGGAPLNVAAHLARLGGRAVLVSRVGADARGRAALEQMRHLGLNTDHVQVDPWLPTGTARAVLDPAGSAAHEFPQPAAWDRIEAAEATLEAASSAEAVVFGTLAQRQSTGAGAVRRIVDAARWRVLDVNLHAPHADREVVLASLARADFVKLNEDEARILAGWLGVQPAAEPLQACLAERFGATSLCITHGERGAVLWHDGRWVRQDAFPAVVADTVGAGDSFLAMLLAELTAGSAAHTAMERAARLASYVASQPGAVPPYDGGRFRG